MSNGNYQYQHIFISTGKGGKPHAVNAMSCSIGSVETKTSAQVEEIHQDLVCYNSGEERLFIKCWYANPNANIYPYNKSKLVLFLLEPKFGENGNFVYQLVITPKPGLFPVKEEMRVSVPIKNISKFAAKITILNLKGRKKKCQQEQFMNFFLKKKE